MQRPTQLLVSELILMGAEYNPRKMSESEMVSLRKSLRVFGPVQPIIVNSRTSKIVGGHQRVEAARLEGMQFLPVTWVDLDEVGERSLNLALNRIHGEWDEDLLGPILAALKAGGADLGTTGFQESEVDRLLALMAATSKGHTDPDDAPGLPDMGDVVSVHGEVIRLGQHRVLCGDSTNVAMVARLMGDDLADCLWTDPPYGVDYEGKRTLRRKIENDVSDGLAMMLLAVFTNSDSSLRPGAPIYIASPGGPRLVDFLKGFMEVGWLFRQGLVWVKDSFVVGHSDYHYRHEQILFGYKPGEGRLGRGGPGWFGDNKQDSVFDVVRPYNSKEHPTMKPVELIERCLGNSTQAGETVFDPFLGSGSTLIACEKTGRRCLGVEIDRQYADVIVQRWENFTGKKAERSDG